jgi:hypothetical protein
MKGCAYMTDPTIRSRTPLTAQEIVLDTDDAYELHLEYVRRGWSDGLPVIPATPDRVRAMLEFTPDGWENHLRIPPAQGVATAEALAIQAVMAGCRPEQFPVVLAAIRAMSDETFNLTTVQATTHSVAPFIVVNGPRGEELGFSGGSGCLGPGSQGNATVGRAVRLALLNIGGGVPGVGDMASQGHPGKYTYCIAENQQASPWSPLHTDRGFDAADNTVTVFGAGAPVNVNNHVGTTAVHILDTFADAMVTIGGTVTYRRAYGKDGRDQTGEFIVLFAPEHAATIAAQGWSKDDVQRYLFEHARIPTERMPHTGMAGMHEMPRWIQLDRPGWAVPVVADPSCFAIIVAGGPGKHSSCIPTHGSATRSVTVKWD